MPTTVRLVTHRVAWVTEYTEALATQRQDAFPATHHHGGTRIVDLSNGTEEEHLIRRQHANTGTTESCGW